MCHKIWYDGESCKVFGFLGASKTRPYYENVAEDAGKEASFQER